MSEKLKVRCQDLGPIPSGAAPPGHFHLDLGWRQSRFWLYFALADPSAVERGVAYRRQIGVDGGTIRDSSTWQASA